MAQNRVDLSGKPSRLPTFAVDTAGLKADFGESWFLTVRQYEFQKAGTILKNTRRVLEDSICWGVRALPRQKFFAMQLYLEGLLARHLGDFRNARDLLYESVQRYEKMEREGARSPNIYNVLLELGITLGKAGDLPNARAANEKAMEKVGMFMEAGIGNFDSLDYAYAYNDLGNMYLEHAWFDRGYLGQEDPESLQEALRNFRQSLDIRLRYQDQLISREKLPLSYENLAFTLARLGRLEEALVAMDSAKYFLERLGGVGNGEKSYLHYFYAEIYMRKKDFARALGAYQASYQLRERTITDFPPALAEPLIGMANAACGQDLPEEALSYAERAITFLAPQFDLRAPNGNNPYKALLVEALCARAEILKKTGRDEAALDDYMAVASLASRMRGEASGEQAKLHTSGNDQILRAHSEGIRLAIALYRKKADPAYFDRAFELSEKSKAVVLLENLRKNDFLQFIIPRLRPPASERFRSLLQLDRKISALEHRQAGDRDLSQAGAIRDSIINARKAYDLLYADLENAYRNDYPGIFAAFDNQETIPPASVQQNVLGNDSTAMITYTLNDNNLSALIITRNNRYAHTRQVGREFHDALGSLILLLPNEARNNKKSKEDFRQASGHLHSILIAPHLSRLHDEGVTRLIVIPDGPLGYLPFEILVPEGTAKEKYCDLRNAYLLQEFYLSYEYSATILKERIDKHVRKERNEVGVFAPMKFRNNSSLKENSQAAKSIAQASGGSFFSEEQASRHNFLSMAHRFDILIASTHAIADEMVPANSHLVFADPNRPGENEYLYAHELYTAKLPLNHLFLASCETAIGKLRRGEGIISLARGITAAGCASTTVSLWSVPDDSSSTGEIMKNYFRNLAAGMPKDVAMGEAKRTYLDAASDRDRPSMPYYWAELVVTGDTSPTGMEWKETNLSWVVVQAGTVGILLLIVVLVIRRQRRKT